MNKELLERALDQFDEWPFTKNVMVFDVEPKLPNPFKGRELITDIPSWLKFVCTREEFEQAKAEREKSRFTHEFVVRGGTNIEKVWQPCEILFEGQKFVVVRNASGREFSRRKAKIEIREIDTRTAEQKCIDDLSGFMPYVNTPAGMFFDFELFIEQVKGGKVSGLRWTEE